MSVNEIRTCCKHSTKLHVIIIINTAHDTHPNPDRLNFSKLPPADPMVKPYLARKRAETGKFHDFAQNPVVHGKLQSLLMVLIWW